jgi:ligand-binding sensor domain-containing protein
VTRATGLTLALVAAGAMPLMAQAGFWREDERVIVADQSVVVAVAATENRVYVATATSLGIYDRMFRQWAPPVTVVDGYPREPVTVALADPAEDAVWLGTATSVVRYRPVLRTFDVYPVVGGVRNLAFDRDDPFGGLYVLTAAGWQQLPRGGLMLAPSGPPSGARFVTPLAVREAEARLPFLRTMGANALLDDRLRSYRFTSAAVVPGVEEYWLGTNGMGLVRVDALVALIEPVPAGLLSTGVGAVLATRDGVWVGSDEQSRRTGLTWVSDDLQRYAYEEGPRGTGFRAGVVRALVARGEEIWAGTDQGIVRIEPGVATRRIQTVDGLPDDDVFALAAGPAGVWVGTALGLAFVPADSFEVRRSEGPLAPVLALAAAGESAWVGFTEGLGLAAPDGQVFAAPGADTLAELRDAIVALTLLGDTVVAATHNRLLWRAGAGPWHVERYLGEVAPIYALAGDAGGLWVGGAGGLARVRLAAQFVIPFPVPRDAPAPVRGIAVTDRFIWLGTQAGLVRFSRDALDR